MFSRLLVLLITIRSSLKTQHQLALENLALRQQLAMLRQTVKRPRVSWFDRVFWIIFARYVEQWRALLHALHPDTVVCWHREGFRWYWHWKSWRRPLGRPAIDNDVRKLIRQMQSVNVGWGAPRIHSELLKLGIEISQATVSKYMVPQRKPPSQTWRTFLNNHARDIVGIDFFTVPTATFRVLYVLVMLGHERRTVRHFNVTAHPSAQWTAQQINEAFPWDEAPRYLLRDRDPIYGDAFQRRVDSFGLKEVKTAPQSPWQNPFVERLIGSIRRDCIDHVIVLNEHHLRRILRDYFHYYHTSRNHLSLDKDPPVPRTVERVDIGKVVALATRRRFASLFHTLGSMKVNVNIRCLKGVDLFFRMHTRMIVLEENAPLYVNLEFASHRWIQLSVATPAWQKE
jgi:transposase InsO family protein